MQHLAVAAEYAFHTGTVLIYVSGSDLVGCRYTKSCVPIAH